MEHDVLRRVFPGPLAPGDHLVFSNAGAYTIVLRPPFIRPTPAIVVREDGAWRIVRRRGDLAEVFGPYDPAGG
jgi:diaminopimelate decarboxylase